MVRTKLEFDGIHGPVMIRLISGLHSRSVNPYHLVVTHSLLITKCSRKGVLHDTFLLHGIYECCSFIAMNTFWSPSHLMTCEINFENIMPFTVNQVHPVLLIQCQRTFFKDYLPQKMQFSSRDRNGTMTHSTFHDKWTQFTVIFLLSKSRFYPYPSGLLHWHRGNRNCPRRQWTNPEGYVYTYHMKQYQLMIELQQNKCGCSKGYNASHLNQAKTWTSTCSFI